MYFCIQIQKIRRNIKMKKLFTSDKFFLTGTILGVIGVLLYAITAVISSPENYGKLILMAVDVTCTIGLYVSYKKHNKNVMKYLIGFKLMEILSQVIDGSFPLNLDDKYVAALSIINVIIVIALCINHFVINSDHHSRSGNILINQVLLFAYLIVAIAFGIPTISDMKSILSFIILVCGCFGNMAVIVCVESRLDAYRLDREAAGWTEEAGYPEGYVHEYEKKDNQ